jgi:Rod binding domain-containing protein
MKIDNSLALSSIHKEFSVDTTSDKKLKDSTDAFEAFLIKKVLDISIKRENSIFGKDAGDKIYNSMYNDTMSRSLSGGFGFSQILFNFLKDQQNSQKS